MPRMCLIFQLLRELHQNLQHQPQRLAQALVLINAESEVSRLVQEAEERGVQEAVVWQEQSPGELGKRFEGRPSKGQAF